MGRVYKIIYVFIIVVAFFSTFYEVNAIGSDVINIWEKAELFIKEGIVVQSDPLISQGSYMGRQAKVRFQTVLDFIWSIGLLTIFLSTVVLGIKYMFVSPNEKSKIKQATTPYIIGVVIIFGAVTIWKFIIEVLS